MTIRTPFKETVLRLGESHEVPSNTVHRVGNDGAGISRYLLLQALGKYDFIKVEEAV